MPQASSRSRRRRSFTEPFAAGRLLVLVAAVAVLTLGQPAAAERRPGGKLVPATGSLFGAFVDMQGGWRGNDAAQQDVTTFESQIGRKLGINHHYYGWTEAFPSGLEEWDLANGRIPLISWNGTDLSSITNGSQDSLIRSRAQALKGLGREVFIRWCWEMNGDWSVCNASKNGGGAAEFVAAWRHIHDLFVAEGATNAVWVWCVNAGSVPNEAWNAFDKYYPGEDYVDWVGIDGYNWGSSQSWSSSTNLSSIVAPVYSAYASSKPIMVAETSSSEVGADKAAWIADVQSSLKSRFPSVAAFIWFNVHKEQNWRVDSSPAALAAFRALSADPYFNPTNGGDSSPSISAPPAATAPSPAISPTPAPAPAPAPAPVPVPPPKPSAGLAPADVTAELPPKSLPAPPLAPSPAPARAPSPAPPAAVSPVKPPAASPRPAPSRKSKPRARRPSRAKKARCVKRPASRRASPKSKSPPRCRR